MLDMDRFEIIVTINFFGFFYRKDTIGLVEIF